jgi:hypothetical protein
MKSGVNLRPRVQLVELGGAGGVIPKKSIQHRLSCPSSGYEQS